MHRSVIEDRAADLFSINRAIKDGVMAAMHTSIPGIIQSFDPALQTATVQTAIRRKVRGANGEVMDEKDPLLTDVPVLFLGGGTSALTFPVKVGDECLVVFAELNIDAWYQSGDIQNQVYPRSHSLSDGFAIVGFRSKPRALPSVADDMPEIDQLRVKDRLVANLEGKATSAEDSDKLGGKLPDSFADSEHNHDLVYSKLNHNHDGEYSGVGHLHDELYAKLNHGHDDKYAALGHNHDDVYSLKGHRHDDLYAALLHRHDADYADINHDHDELYARLNHRHDELYADSEHGHAWDQITNKPLSYPAAAHDHEAYLKLIGGEMANNNLVINMNADLWDGKHYSDLFDEEGKPLNAVPPDKLTTPRTLTIGQTGKLFDGSADVAWSLNEIGALPLTGGTINGDVILNGVVAGLAVRRVHYYPDGDFNDLEVEWALRRGANSPDGNANTYWYTNTVYYSNTNYCKQIAYGYVDNRIYTRYRYAGTWNAWENISLGSYPVGAIYMSLSATSPATLFGGTWASIGAGRFLVSAGTGYAAGGTGGSSSHSHELGSAFARLQMQSTIMRLHTKTTNSWPSSWTASVTSSGPSGLTVSGGLTLDGTTDAGTTLPPWYSVYMWRRTA